MKIFKIRLLPIIYMFLVSCIYVNAAEIHVAKTGNDSNTGTMSSPFLTISKAADEAVPGDIIIIHEGTYREYINPSVGGTSDSNRITFKSAEGEEVFVKGSEQIDTWIDNGDNTWSITLPSSFFNDYNPYTLNVNGDFQDYGQWHHRGDVYINNSVLAELRVLNQVKDEPYTWIPSTSSGDTTIYANFGTDNPNTELTEINVRELLFFPTTQGLDYITIDGIRFLHAAPNWQAPNTGESDGNRLTQLGALGANMGKGWIIQNCEVSYSKTAGIMMGEAVDTPDSTPGTYDFGGHLIQNNIITKCGEYGIAGQKGMSGSTIIGNRIEDINYRNEFGGFEPAGIKIWNCVDVLIENNLVRNVIANQTSASQAYCIWIDFANQGTRITRNFLEGSPMTTTALFLEANLGPTLVDNNVIVDRTDAAIFVSSGGSIFAHNLFVNSNFSFFTQNFDNGGSGARNSYTLIPHTLTRATNAKVEVVHNKMYNNIFAGGSGPANFSSNSGEGNLVDRNLYIGGTTPAAAHTNTNTSSFNFTHTITEKAKGIDFSFEFDDSFENILTQYVDGALVGVVPIANQTIEDELGNVITVNLDLNLLDRTGSNPKVGPLENIVQGTNTITVETDIESTPWTEFTIPDVIDPDGTEDQAPYLGTPTTIPGIVEGENYDLGGQGVSFNDNNSKDGDTSFRPNDNVDVGGDGGGGYVIGWFDPDEWLEYTVNIEEGNYTIDLLAASALDDPAPGALELSINGEIITTVDVSSTGDWGVYDTFSASGIDIQASMEAVLRIRTTGGFNLDRITFVRDGELSVGSFEEELIASIYPNPVKDILNLKLKEGHIPTLKIYSMDGKLLLSEMTDSMDVSKLSQGVYLLAVKGHRAGVRFVKE